MKRGTKNIPSTENAGADKPRFLKIKLDPHSSKILYKLSSRAFRTKAMTIQLLIAVARRVLENKSPITDTCEHAPASELQKPSYQGEMGEQP